MMITTYKIFEKIQQDPQWIQKLLIGGILMFIPIVNLFALGYLYRFTSDIHFSGRIKLPHWNNWGQMFIEGLIFLGVILLYGFIPFLIGWGLSLLIVMITFGFLGWFPFIPLSIVSVIVPSLIVVGILPLIDGKGFITLIRRNEAYLKPLLKCWKVLLLANLTFVGLQFIGLPLYGFAFFVGFLVLIPYTLFVLSNVIKEE